MTPPLLYLSLESVNDIWVIKRALDVYAFDREGVDDQADIVRSRQLNRMLDDALAGIESTEKKEKDHPTS